MPRPPPLAAAEPGEHERQFRRASCHAGTAVCASSTAVYEATPGADAAAGQPGRPRQPRDQPPRHVRAQPTAAAARPPRPGRCPARTPSGSRCPCSSASSAWPPAACGGTAPAGRGPRPGSTGSARSGQRRRAGPPAAAPAARSGPRPPPAAPTPADRPPVNKYAGIFQFHAGVFRICRP